MDMCVCVGDGSRREIYTQETYFCFSRFAGFGAIDIPLVFARGFYGIFSELLCCPGLGNGIHDRVIMEDLRRIFLCFR